MKLLIAAAAWLCVAGAAVAQAYPNRPVRVIVPWPPGQATDLAARIVADKLSQQLEIAKATQAPDLKERYLALGMETAANTPDEMGAMMRREQERYGSIIKGANIKVEP